LVQMARQPRPDRERIELGRLALPMLDTAVKDRPDDVDALEARGYALWLHRRTDDALAAFQTALERAPRREETLVDIATLAEALDQRDAAIGYWQQATAVTPWFVDYRTHLARLLAGKEDWPAARDECRAALGIHPRSGELRKLLIRCYLHTGQSKEARAQLDKLLELNPNSQDELRQWFAEQSR